MIVPECRKLNPMAHAARSRRARGLNARACLDNRDVEVKRTDHAMRIRFVLLAALLALLAACGPQAPTGGTEVFRISAREAQAIPGRVEQSINTMRASNGVGPVVINRELTQAANAHARDMSAQNRPWHFGSDGSSPIDRVRRTGFAGQFLGENISETFETDAETIAAWMQDPATRAVILDPRARNLGFSWYQEQNGKIWWTLVTGT